MNKKEQIKIWKRFEKNLAKKEMDIWEEVEGYCVGSNIGNFRVSIVHRFNDLRELIFKEIRKLSPSTKIKKEIRNK